ncbi:hypothetical protein [Aeromicrobium duanguangcaii]|uniref:hypothetical protein n=1 Tax=Aeromicrobium duanguangcaii TaxID=2968086 RepID=UPI00201739AD|nr:hypothetical protein [Aeromicrobium duanguangcaii]MCL3838610.1 hypothetical protein [Aeromicrobium duanguangcaii]
MSDAMARGGRTMRNVLRVHGAGWLGAALIASLLTVMTSAPTHAADRVGHTEIVSIKGDPTNKRFVVKYKNKENLHEALRLKVSVYPSATRRGGTVTGAKYLSGKKGSHTTHIPMKTRAGVYEVFIENPAARGQIQKSFFRLLSPGKKTTTKVVTAAEASANAAVLTAVAATLQFSKAKTVKWLGGVVLGWQALAGMKTALSGSKNTCPKLAKGQYIRTTSWWSRDGKKATSHAEVRVWHKKTHYTNGKAPVCTVKQGWTV